MSGSGFSWATCKSAPRSRQITTPTPHHSVFYRPDALAAAQPTASKHWRDWSLQCWINIYNIDNHSHSEQKLFIWIYLHSSYTHTHPFNGHVSGTTRVNRYQKGKTNLDFTEARDSEWQWHQLRHMQVCTTSLQTDNHASTPRLSFLQAGCPSCRPTNSVKALKAISTEGNSITYTRHLYKFHYIDFTFPAPQFPPPSHTEASYCILWHPYGTRTYFCRVRAA